MSLAYQPAWGSRFFGLGALGMEARASCMLGKYFATELHPQRRIFHFLKEIPSINGIVLFSSQN